MLPSSPHAKTAEILVQLLQLGLKVIIQLAFCAPSAELWGGTTTSISNEYLMVVNEKERLYSQKRMLQSVIDGKMSYSNDLEPRVM